MTEPHVVSALRAKRAEIGGYIADLERKLKRQRAILTHIDETIRLFAPSLNPDAIPPKRTYRRTRYFAKGELSRHCLDAFRKANGRSITTSEITALVVEWKGFPSNDAVLTASITEMALTVLRRLCKRGAIVKSGTSRDAQWRLAN
jgi:hypothetical protein